MAHASRTSPPESATAPPNERHAGLAIFVIAAAQLMVVLDGTIVNIALPSIQRDFTIASSALTWVITAYALAFGGLLLLGGRAGDIFGRRRMFRVGLVVFTIASLLGGLAPNVELLIAARVLQGVGGAIIAPTALSLIATTFAEGPARSRALGVYAAMAGIGSTVGLLLGGLLTDALNWRWVMFINIPIGIGVLLGTRILAEGTGGRGRLDVPGALTGTAGLVSLVYAITRGGEAGFGDRITLGCFAAAAVLLALFLVIQARSTHPMLPLKLLRDRNRAATYTTILFVGSAMFASFYFLTLYMQQVLDFGPMRAGLAYLPYSAGMMVSAGLLGPRLVARFPSRVIVAGAMLLGTIGMFWFSRLTPDSSYTLHLMPAMFLTALGLGGAFLPLTLSAVAGVAREDSGIASAILNTAQQIGGALGLSVLATLSTTAANNALPDAAQVFFTARAAGDPGLLARAADALTQGYGAAFLGGCALLLVALLVALVGLNAKRQSAPTGEATPVQEPAATA